MPSFRFAVFLVVVVVVCLHAGSTNEAIPEIRHMAMAVLSASLFDCLLNVSQEGKTGSGRA